MRQKAKLIFAAIFIVSVLGLVWINTGSNKQIGYEYCGGGGFIPQSEIIPDNPGGPCLGNQITTRRVNGRYENTPVLNTIFGPIALLSVIASIVFAMLGRTKSSKKNK